MEATKQPRSLDRKAKSFDPNLLEEKFVLRICKKVSLNCAKIELGKGRRRTSSKACISNYLLVLEMVQALVLLSNRFVEMKFVVPMFAHTYY